MESPPTLDYRPASAGRNEFPTEPGTLRDSFRMLMIIGGAVVAAFTGIATIGMVMGMLLYGGADAGSFGWIAVLMSALTTAAFVIVVWRGLRIPEPADP